VDARIAVFGCNHAPLNDREYEDEFLLPKLEEFKPTHVVQAGDLFEGQHASRWPTPNKYDWTIDDEIREADALLERITAVTPGATRLIVMGNHDENFITHTRIPASYGGMMDWRTRLTASYAGKWQLGTESYTYDRIHGTWRWGQVVVAHGYGAGQNADEDMAISLALPYGAHHLYVGVHTHQPIPVKRGRIRKFPLPVHYTNPGCGRSLKPDYVKRSYTGNWGQGVTLIEATDWRYEKSMVPNSPQWEAETHIYRTAVGYAPENADMMEAG
jgi:hypothetical protein